MKKMTLLSSLVLLSFPIYADFTITGAETTTQTLTGVDAVGIITETGSVITNGVDAVTTNTDTGQTLINDGLIDTTGNDAYGIFSLGASATITNNGTITTAGTSGNGMSSEGASATVANSGTITSTGRQAHGIAIVGASATLTNSGTISTAGLTAYGILSSGDFATVANNGTITTTGEVAPGMISFNKAFPTLINNGTITTEGDSSSGILAEANSATATLTNNGTITTAGDGAEGIRSFGNFATLTNSGQITIAGDDADGMESSGASATITNTGQITTGGTSAHGIEASGNDASVTNETGSTITTTDDNSIGINATAQSATINNHGSISTAGAAAHGISITSTGASVSNTSPNSIVTTGDGAHGINSTADNATIINSGTGLISTSGAAAHGILSSGDNASITNCGIIQVTGPNSNGINSSGDNAVVTNGGLISSAQSTAIVFTGLNPSLILEGGSVSGGISSTNPLNLTVTANGPNRIVIFGGGAFQNISVTDPFVVVGSTFAIVNPTGFVMQTAMLEDLTDGIFSALSTNQYDYFNCCCPDPSIWVQLIGSHRQESGTTPYYIDQGGVVVGLTRGACSLFAGASFENGVVENPILAGTGVTCGTCGACSTSSLSGDKIEESDAASYFGGVSLEKFYCVSNPMLENLFLSGAVAGGYVRWDNRRTIENNNAASGLENGHAPNTVWLLTGEMTAATRFEECFATVRPGFGMLLRYAGYYMGDYQDHNSSARMEVFNRNVQFIKLRGEASLSFKKAPGKYLEPYLAVAGRFQLSGNRVTSNLLGVPLNFNLAADHNIGEKIAGMRGVWDWGSSRLFFNVEGMWDTENAARALGEIGLTHAY